ncbi:hypothetical protein C5C18_00870 [Rathayibacter tritici]|uniref:hypothetical protein n=1 Tax=Rathayibacter tritici TaxID=33888 RepID=UPI000831AB7E|nr:hypothetical protein C5C06_03615 [Rathayibacter tritici]PPF66385.1 hypothetical protein C5C21_09215 [Rathayibacter tritici]PPG09564.1 hypothetical protein C5C18_00870 [Rathayibacter tritici]PPI13624.1 hypothetical protein C5D07_09445 [Rathayibacter tritici]PPI43442.1 hypothetical protein C5D18_09680 [Rathayibacter tritici]
MLLDHLTDADIQFHQSIAAVTTPGLTVGALQMIRRGDGLGVFVVVDGHDPAERRVTMWTPALSRFAQVTSAVRLLTRSTSSSCRRSWGFMTFLRAQRSATAGCTAADAR